MSPTRTSPHGQLEEIRVLHVDDEPDFADLVATFLSREDDQFAVETALSATEGIEHLATERVDCVVSDYDMPGRNGVEFLEAVREDHPELPFILYTGKGSEEVASDAISAGVTDYLQKESGTDQYAVLANRVRNAVERYRADQERHRQQEAIESAQEGISILSTDSEFIYVNQAYADLYGYEPEEMLGEHWELVYPDDEVPFAREEIVPTVADEGYWHGETRGLRADGTTFPEDHVVSRTRNEELVCTVRDLSDRRERETELRTKIRAMDEAPVGITITDPDQEDNPVVYINDRFEELTGYDRDDVIGRNCRFLQGDDTAEEPVATMREAIDAQEPVTVELLNYRKDGTDFWNRVSIAPVHTEDGSVSQYVGFQQDITEQRRHAEQLQALHERNRMLMTVGSSDEIADIGVAAASEILGLDACSIHLYDAEQSGLVPVAATDTLSDLLGEVPLFTGGDSIAWRAYEQGESLAIDDVQDDPDRKNQETPMRSELYLPLGDHGIMLAGSPEPNSFDEQEFVLGQILAGNLTLALDQVRQTDQLRAHEAELIRQNDRLEEFTSIVSHDLRNPLSVAEGHLDLVREEYESELLDPIEHALERIDTLITDLRTLAREGETISEVESVDIATIADSCWASVETADATLVTDIDRRITADRSRLKQVFENLVRNAVEYGGADVTITVGELENGFYIEDDGPGIPPEERTDVFETGYSTNDEGTGFGLSIVEQIVAAHDWDIRVVDGTDGGARFEITGVELVGE
ncbi:PAS domain-containing protein [Halobaculum rubrum]|uniref:hybrid sensor histidine kinase/response regulator n=1 Tax=Halobaculum rubrum TaxID=2872158 RepID=UPI001CA44C3A|nr:PAS domain-containing protein [Halobaculum rubrum]QZX99170.1 PAS domain S-box protein [Halobaculum rubrum]